MPDTLSRHVAPRIVYCADCDNPIHPKRIAVVPDAKYCVICQPKHDDPHTAVMRSHTRPDEFDSTDFELTPRSKARPDEKFDELPEMA